MYKKLNYILNGREKITLLFIILIVLIGSMLELLGVAIFTPFIEGLTNFGNISDSKVYSLAKSILGLSDYRNYVIVMAIMIITVYVVKNLFLSFEKNAIYRFSYSMQQRVASNLLSAYLLEPYTFHLNTNPAELIRTIRIDTDYFAKLVIHVIELAMEIIVCIALVAYLFIVSPMITIVVASLLAVSALGYSALSKNKLKYLGQKSQEYDAEIYKYVGQALGGIKEIKVLNCESFFLDEFTKVFAKNVRCLRISRLMAVLPKYFVEAVSIVGLMLAVIIMMVTNPENVGEFVPQLAVFATAAFRLMPSVGRINEHTSAIYNTIPSADLIYKDLRDVENIALSDKVVLDNKRQAKKYELVRGINVDDISFKYPDGERNVLENASFTITKGETVAIIGESGAGKSTLADIILGILTPQHGEVKVDESDIFADISRWHDTIGYIPQAIYLSDDTIRNNIAFGIDRNHIDDVKVMEAAKKARLLDFIKELPDGLDTIVGERGARLSGGQRQRIGIARALYNDPDVLILDEATSALDNETERAVMESIDGLHGVKTLIIIAHRLSTIKNADKIYEVKDKKVLQRNKSELDI